MFSSMTKITDHIFSKSSPIFHNLISFSHENAEHGQHRSVQSFHLKSSFHLVDKRPADNISTLQFQSSLRWNRNRYAEHEVEAVPDWCQLTLSYFPWPHLACNKSGAGLKVKKKSHGSRGCGPRSTANSHETNLDVSLVLSFLSS